MNHPQALVFAALTAACAAGAQRNLETWPRRYDCEGAVLTVHPDALIVDGEAAALVARDDESARYARAAADVEYVIPRDPYFDAVVKRRAVTIGYCVASGGYTDALRRFMTGGSVEEVAKSLAITEREARLRIRSALNVLRCRSLNDEC